MSGTCVRKQVANLRFSEKERNPRISGTWKISKVYDFGNEKTYDPETYFGNLKTDEFWILKLQKNMWWLLPLCNKRVGFSFCLSEKIQEDVVV